MATKDPKFETLEHGNIYFLYRPRVQEEHPESRADVERFYMVLKPDGAARYRMAVIGRKRLPDLPSHERTWGFVDMIAGSPAEIEQALQAHHYRTKTRGEREQPAARPAGEGVYAFVQKGRAMHLAYVLELPEHPGPVQEELKIAPEGSLVVSIKNPETGAPRGAGLGKERKADYPKRLQKEFAGRRFAPSDPRLLDYEGAEFVLIGAAEDVAADLDVDLGPDRETPQTADIIRQLRMVKSRHPLEPLFGGDWR